MGPAGRRGSEVSSDSCFLCYGVFVSTFPGMREDTHACKGATSSAVSRRMLASSVLLTCTDALASARVCGSCMQHDLGQPHLSSTMHAVSTVTCSNHACVAAVPAAVMLLMSLSLAPTTTWCTAWLRLSTMRAGASCTGRHARRPV